MRTACIVLAVICAIAEAGDAGANSLSWTKLPSIPDKEGFAGTFAGTSGEYLLVAGGANFPDKKPWESGTKVWHDSVFALKSPEGAWKSVGRLPRPAAYGVSLSVPGGILCAGGGDARQHFTDVFLLQMHGDELRHTPLPALPRPCAFMSGALVGSTVFVCGGIETPDATQALQTLWALDLSAAKREWKELEPCPGAGRMLASAGSDAESFFLFSGVALKAGADGKPVREYLRDAWSYRSGAGWRRLPDLPRAAAAAPSPAPSVIDTQLLILGGDDGTRVDFKPQQDHPGFNTTVLVFDTRALGWTSAGNVPFSRVTVPAVRWSGGIVIPNGEARPGVRSPEVWFGRFLVR
ncbi:MAG TPA: galactose oxidase [Planctomycetota bacterium]|nr:galactose oxidase [Planctomycetota bacterium]